MHEPVLRLRVGLAAVVAVVLLSSAGCSSAALVPSTIAAQRGSGEPGPADGALVEAVSPFDADQAAITRLDPALRRAVQRAARAARRDGVPFVITSGWRSASHQQWLLDRAVERYGSAAEAAHWVSTPAQSEHVRGKAVDIGHTDADSWLQQHGADFGLCQRYANEMWHFELATSPGGECPEQYASAAERYADDDR